jgi:hypothetical protein
MEIGATPPLFMMETSPMLEISRRRPPTRSEVPPDALHKCPDCGEELDRSQPDSERPEWLLAACTCGQWYRYDGLDESLTRLVEER